MFRKRKPSPSTTGRSAPPDPLHRQARRVLWTARITVIGLSIVLIALAARVLQLQKRPDQRIADRIGAVPSKHRLIERRGSILDARGRPLAISTLGYRLYIDPMLVKDPAAFSARVAPTLGLDPARLDRILDRRFDKRYAVVERLMSDEQYDAFKSIHDPAVAAEPRLVRHYPQGPAAGQIVGFVGIDHHGLDGLEYALDPILNGSPGQYQTIRDAARRPLWVERRDYELPTDGFDVRLSIDLVVEQIAEQEIAAVCTKYEAKAGELVVLDPRNGQILAMANWPPFDPADPTSLSPEQRRNRAVTDPYEPGSVFKPFLHAKSTELKLARPDQIIDCTSSAVWVTDYGRVLHDTHAYGAVTWDQVLIVSSNIGMAKVASQMGDKTMYETLMAYGFGRPTGVALPGESPGIVTPLDKWTRYTTTSVPFGQEIAVTPLQLARAFTAFANDGRVVRPSILAGEAANPVLTPAISAEAAMHTRRVLRRVVTEGTGRRARSKLYQIWGKTGTAQVADGKTGRYKYRTYTANFICGAPFDDPRIIVLAVVHEPNPKIGYYGGTVAAPAAKNVVERTLPYLGVAPDMTDAQLADLRQTAAPAVANYD